MGLTCVTDACTTLSIARGLCFKHYQRLRRESLADPPQSLINDRLDGRIVVGKGDDPCWEWIGARGAGGRYGILMVGRRPKYVHRLMYERMIGSIPQRLVIDHLCRNTVCCNPAHLEVVTARENAKRAVVARLSR